MVGRLTRCYARRPMERSYRRPNWYQVLQLDIAADPDIISTVYRRLALRYHPDRDPSQEAQMRMRELNQAYAVLKDPEQRARYDAELSIRRDRRATDRLVKRPVAAAHDRERRLRGGWPARRPAERHGAGLRSLSRAGRWARSQRTIRTFSSGWNGHQPGVTCEERSPTSGGPLRADAGAVAAGS